jgi:hypothetical protein
MLEEYQKIKLFFDRFRKIRGMKKSNKLILDIEEIRKNLKSSLVVRQQNNGHFSKYM